VSIAQTILPEFDHETAKTRLLLERVPEERADWKPHLKSRTLGELVVHLAMLPNWTPVTLKQPEYDTNPTGAEPSSLAHFESIAKTIGAYDQAVKSAREILVGTTDGEMMAPWVLKNGGKVLFTMPRVTVFRAFVLNHSIHHRGQLSVYLRMCDVAIPAIYGPTADTLL
jgi:uncharacterized damage-inducible protein DinB